MANTDPPKGVPSSVPNSDSELGTRITAVADLFDNRKYAADAAGVSTDQLARYMRGENTPPVTVADKLAAAKGVSLKWLARGEGEMYDGTYAAQERAAYVPDSDYAFVPLYDVNASAGQGAFVDGEQSKDALAFKRDWLRRNVAGKIDDLALINVRGDSMDPTLRDGDVVMVNKAETEVTDGIYVFLLDGWLMVKRLQRRVGEGGTELWVISEHPSYEPFQLPPLDDFNEPTKIIGRVVWACRRF